MFCTGAAISFYFTKMNKTKCESQNLLRTLLFIKDTELGWEGVFDHFYCAAGFTYKTVVAMHRH